jgi:hypothetical protein
MSHLNKQRHLLLQSILKILVPDFICVHGLICLSLRAVFTGLSDRQMKNPFFPAYPVIPEPFILKAGFEVQMNGRSVGVVDSQHDLTFTGKIPFGQLRQPQ